MKDGLCFLLLKETHAVVEPLCRLLLMAITDPTVPATQQKRPPRTIKTFRVARAMNLLDRLVLNSAWCSCSHLRMRKEVKWSDRETAGREKRQCGTDMAPCAQSEQMVAIRAPIRPTRSPKKGMA